MSKEEIAKTRKGQIARNSSFLKIWFALDELCYTKYMDRAVEDARRLRRPTRQEMAYEPEFPRYAVLSEVLAPVFTKSKIREYEAISTIAGDRDFLAVLAHKSKFGSYPSELKQVEKKLGWSLPNDPLGDAPFHYRLQGKGFVLYGVGRNLRMIMGWPCWARRAPSTWWMILIISTIASQKATLIEARMAGVFGGYDLVEG